VYWVRTVAKWDIFIAPEELLHAQCRVSVFKAIALSKI
jgi:hypothetical protein